MLCAHRYIGEFYKGKRHGQGKYVSEIGATYQGQWREGMRSGHGIEVTVPPGDSGTYQGDFCKFCWCGVQVVSCQGRWREGLDDACAVFWS